jgi:probable phosphoglycerate mutase
MAGLVRDLIARDPSPDWRLVASPLPRAQLTAQAIAHATGLPIEPDERLAEIACGDWEGLTWDEVVAMQDPGERSSRQWIFDAPGGERFEDVHGRVSDFLASLPAEPARRVIAVSHGASGRVLRGAYAGLDRDTILGLDVPQDAVFRLQNGQIDRFECEPVS